MCVYVCVFIEKRFLYGKFLEIQKCLLRFRAVYFRGEKTNTSKSFLLSFTLDRGRHCRRVVVCPARSRLEFEYCKSSRRNGPRARSCFHANIHCRNSFGPSGGLRAVVHFFITKNIAVAVVFTRFLRPVFGGINRFFWPYRTRRIYTYTQMGRGERATQTVSRNRNVFRSCFSRFAHLSSGMYTIRPIAGGRKEGYQWARTCRCVIVPLTRSATRNETYVGKRSS